MSIYEAAMNILVANVEAKRWTVNEVHDNKETRKKKHSVRMHYLCVHWNSRYRSLGTNAEVLVLANIDDNGHVSFPVVVY